MFVVLFRGQKIQTSVERMFRIWKDRRVYDNSFLKELEQLIEPARQSQAPSQLTGPSFKVGGTINFVLKNCILITFYKFHDCLAVFVGGCAH